MQRIDQALVERGLCESREKARRAILANQVRVNQQPARKPSDSVKPGDTIELVARERYVSRGGTNLGASTGGFTDCLLQAGAARVHAVDVGHGQLAWKLRQDPRVVVMERVNARYLSPAAFPQPFQPVDLVVIDCSFISLRKILPAAVALLAHGGRIVALIKPQFEAGKTESDRGAGVITDPAVHQRVIDEIEAFARAETKLTWRGVTESPILGPAGNKEFLVLLENLP